MDLKPSSVRESRQGIREREGVQIRVQPRVAERHAGLAREALQDCDVFAIEAPSLSTPGGEHPLYLATQHERNPN